MCLLMACMPGSAPSREHLENACINNSDGFGYAVHFGDRIVTGRGMNSTKTIDNFYRDLELAGPNGFGMFHARLTTHGKTNTENCHPFRVGGDKDIILGHNGILPIIADGDRSDTRVFAEDVLPAMGVGVLDSRTGFRALEEWAAGSKLVILSNSPKLRDQMYIVNESAGHWADNIWWSNSSYQYRHHYNHTGYYPAVSKRPAASCDLIKSDMIQVAEHYGLDIDENSDELLCLICADIITEKDIKDGICSTCNSCLDCWDHANSCLCYSPAYAKYDSDQMAWEY